MLEQVNQALCPHAPAPGRALPTGAGDDDHVAIAHLFSALFSPTGYFGDEAGDGAGYVYAALYLEVPPALKRRSSVETCPSTTIRPLSMMAMRSLSQTVAMPVVQRRESGVTSYESPKR